MWHNIYFLPIKLFSNQKGNIILFNLEFIFLSAEVYAPQKYIVSKITTWISLDYCGSPNPCTPKGAGSNKDNENKKVL